MGRTERSDPPLGSLGVISSDQPCDAGNSVKLKEQVLDTGTEQMLSGPVASPPPHPGDPSAFWAHQLSVFS